MSDAGMDYAEHPVPAELRRHVQCLWLLRDDAPDDAIQTIWSDGRCELLAEFGVPLRFHGADSVHAIPSPKLGEHNDAVYGGWLGLSAEEITGLREGGVI